MGGAISERSAAVKHKELVMFEPSEVVPLEVDGLQHDGNDGFGSVTEEVRQLMLANVL